ncbi:MAG TPA: signal recognition particle-docking protein FtsY [Chloroflexota bacterium]|jgi:fused signal recognition particle receptor
MYMFERFKRLNPFRDTLQKTREGVFSRMTGLFTEQVIDDALWEELEELLIRADVGVDISLDIVQKLQVRVAREHITQARDLEMALRDELLDLLGGAETEGLRHHPPLTSIMMVGVNGVGKTTSIAKLTRYLQEQKKTVIIAAGDTFRAAAVEQLSIWGERLGVTVIRQTSSADPGAVVYDAMQAGLARGAEYVIIDTAGRLHTKFNLMEELKKVQRVAQKVDPSAIHEVLLVLDATSGQNALEQTRVFGEAVGVTGVILTKLDGTAKGGVAFAIRRRLNVPIKFVGTGEKVQDFAPFDAQQFVSALFNV